MVMVEYGLFILLYLATLVAPAGKTKIQLSISKDGQKQVLFLEKSSKKMSPNETLWILTAQGDTQKMEIVINNAKNEMKVSDLTSDPIKITEFLKIPKDAAKTQAFQPSDAMLKEKHTPVMLQRTGNKVQMKQTKGWMETFQNVEVSW